MKLFIHLPLLLLLLSASLSGAVNAAEITLAGNDGFKLKADYFAGQANNPGVLMLHQCNAERSMYQVLGKKLAAQGIHALSLDFRMYGESITETVDLKKIQAAESDRSKRMALFSQHSKHWPADVMVAEQYLREKIGSKASLGVIGASCGGGQAIRLAGSKAVDALMFFSSGMDEDMLTRYSKLKSTPTFVIAAQGDEYTFNSSQKLFKATKHPQTRLNNYKGDGHGHPLFKLDPSLADNMVSWFKLQLNIGH